MSKCEDTKRFQDKHTQPDTFAKVLDPTGERKMMEDLAIAKDKHLRRKAEDIFDDCHKIIIAQAPFVTKEVILKYPQGKRTMDDIINMIYLHLRAL